MSTLSDGLANVQALTAKIAALQKGTETTAATSSQQTTDPSAALLTIQQNFNSMLNDLISTDSKDDEKDNDYLTSFLNDYQTTATQLNTLQTDLTNQTETAAN